MEISTSPPPFWRASKPRGRKRQGVKYEAAAQAHFASLFPNWQPSPWLHFCDAHGTRWCQPDGWAEFHDSLLLVEFKYQHTPDAWWQLRMIYQPLLEHLTAKAVSVLEVVKWYDCATAFPEPARLVADPRGWRGREFGVHIWRP